MKENKPELDLSVSKCHVCGAPMWKDIPKRIERCTHYACSVKNIDFSIRVKEDLKK